MIFSSTISTPKSTLITAPVRTVLKLSKGLIYVVETYLPPGSSGLLHVQIFDASYQVWPTTRGESFRGDNLAFKYDDLYMMDSEPFQLLIITWNEDDTFSHDCFVHVGLVSKAEYIARFLPLMQVDAMQKMFEQILAEQEARKTQTTWGETGAVSEEMKSTYTTEG